MSILAHLKKFLYITNAKTKKNIMERHTRGLKTDRSFYEHNGKPYEFIGFSEDKAVLSPMTGDSTLLVVSEETFSKDFAQITQGGVFDLINNDDDDEHADMMARIGVGYI